ncbi:hypothetical protein [Nocardia asteroides]|uniref:hypothetical protein n=1 Tax=Nocardia asteroides TaxID=1824 RepID=UPI001E2CD0ED|nr:hypothetical protein [Nocardia asteroides]UGT61810.1 hypothetical protein LTT61_00170 [Nocardia asteroides]
MNIIGLIALIVVAVAAVMTTRRRGGPATAVAVIGMVLLAIAQAMQVALGFHWIDFDVRTIVEGYFFVSGTLSTVGLIMVLVGLLIGKTAANPHTPNPISGFQPAPFGQQTGTAVQPFGQYGAPGQPFGQPGPSAAPYGQPQQQFGQPQQQFGQPQPGSGPPQGGPGAY